MATTVSRPHICLSMIVRNEGAVIERCLAAALPLIDAAVLCDTGSSDATPTLARDYLSRRNVPVKICRHPWQNFGANRTAALAEARQFVDEHGWPLDRTYWLLLDADLELVVDPEFTFESLSGDAITLRQRSDSLSYWNLRLVRASLDWSVVGATHERYTCPAMPPLEQHATLWIRDHGDGGSKADKLTRDIAWLTGQLAETPDDPRTLFYLAQSYRAAGDPLKALLLYRRRAAMDDGHEEVWYSKLCMGRTLAEGGHLEAGAKALMEAHDADTARAEPLYELSKLYRRHGRLDEAIACADRGLSLSAPLGRWHIVHADVYEYKLHAELARAAVQTPHAGRGFDACERVALSRTVPHAAVDEARLLEVCYVEPIQGMQFLPLRPALPAPYRPCNPSILRTDTGYLVACRAVNYEQRRLQYRSLDADGVYRTRNVLMRLDDAFNVMSEQEIVFDEPPVREASVRGLEDCRLMADGSALYVTCTTADRHPSGMVHQSICRIDAGGRVVAHHPLTGAFDTSHQKNWLPFTGGDGHIRALYGYDPITVLNVSSETGAYDVDRQVANPLNAAHWRGSAGPLAWPDGPAGRRIVLVHEVVHRQGPDSGWERIYMHRFVECDAGFRLTRVSRPFVFAHKGVEFVCGMAPSHNGADLIVGLGMEDREAYLGRIPFSRVDALLDARHVA